jgi:hypothetical protein
LLGHDQRAPPETRLGRVVADENIVMACPEKTPECGVPVGED